jgi:hypothetical protein
MLTVKRAKRRVKAQREELAGAKRKLERARQALARVIRRDSQWGGSRAVTNEIIRIVDGRARVTSRKRSATHPLSLQNPGSDHSEGNHLADAVDFAIVEAHGLKNEVSRKLGGPASVADFAAFRIRRNGHTYRVQPIAGTHGTGPHLHFGVERVA